MPVSSKPYTHEMVIIHRVFRREATVLERLVASAGVGDVARAAQLTAAIREYVGGLHHHHHLEDELIWPLLRERAGLHTDLVTRMEKQHGQLDTSLQAIDALLPQWEGQASAEVRDDVAASLASHRAVLVEHLDEEEEQIIPLIAEHLSVDEWNLVGRRGLEAVPRNKVMHALGAILEDATPDERRYFLAKVPAIGRVMWRLVGERQYRQRMSRLRERSGKW
ncbi:hemerythrin domain-containing protein [Micromonospora sp. NPDC051543]|uniref:hemerythrin domain-containing protein n=1 Tax=Micromonospora sp. NPDC051543 TaxID=3364287 RepID=UPI0037B565F2